jgi:hypothetical protein
MAALSLVTQHRFGRSFSRNKRGSVKLGYCAQNLSAMP